MLELIKKLYPHAMAPVSPGTDRVVDLLCQELDFTVHEYASGMEYNGWTVPQSWEVLKAELYKEHLLIFDGTVNPLAVFGYSQSFQGTLTLDELHPHLSSRPDFPSAYGYHCDLYYKPHLKDWGFSIPHHLRMSLTPGTYHVDLETRFTSGTMKVLDYFLPGKSRDTILFNAHNCHAFQANDDLSGVAVGVELMRRLAQQENYFSYRLIIAPEHFGTVFYLANLPREVRETFKYCTFLEMLGNDNRLLLQRTFNGDTWIDKAAEHYLRQYTARPEIDDFRTSVGNDETVWEAPGYEVPTLSLSRWPFAEYHTTYDSPENIHPDKLDEALKVVLGYLNILETNRTVERCFEGLIALSNPKYDLYKPVWDPSKGLESSSQRDFQWNRLMNYVPRYFNGEMTILEIADRHDLPYEDVYTYLTRFQEKGLVKFAEVPAAANGRKSWS